MDVFGTIVGAIDLVSKLVGYLQAVKGAKEDRLKFLSEISALGALLEILRGRLGNSTDESGDGISNMLVKAGIGGPLRACYDTLKSTVDGLERLVSNANPTKPSPLAEMMRDLRWPFRQEDLRTMLGKTERLKSLVSLALQTSLMDFIEKARDELEVVGLNVEGIKSTVSSLETEQKAHTKRIESLQGDLISLGAMLQGVTSGITAMQHAVATIDRNQREQERRAIINWLSPPEFDQKRVIAFEKRAAGTGEWFLSHLKFIAWRQGEFNVLWCPGNPGVGKSVMTSIVIHRLQEIMSENVVVVFIYFEYTTENYTTRQLVEALLSQFVRRGLSNLGMESLQRCMAGNRPMLEELWTILEAEVATYDRVFVVIDALDEADVAIWAPLLGRLRALSQISLIATSRDMAEIAEELQPSQRLDIMADGGDLRRYIEGRFSASTGSFKRLLNANASLRADIITGVVEKADGMFLLARLHMNSLESKTRASDLRQALTELPGNLKSAYDATISRIKDEDKPLAYRIFSWVMHAVQRMSIRDLQYALAVEDGMTAIDTDLLHDQAYLTSVCVGLVILRDETILFRRYHEVIGLVHYTTQEYLRNHLSTYLPHPAHLAITCLQYLSFNCLEIDKRRLRETSFAEYAIYSWGEHARTYYHDETVRRLSMELLRDHQKAAVLGSFSGNTTGFSPVQLCAHFGLKDYLSNLLDNGSDINSRDPDGDTAVTEAAICGREDILKLLLAREGVNVNPKGWNGATPLIRAAMSGHQGIVELFLARKDVDANSRDDQGRTAIGHAAENGYSGVVGLLMARDDVNINSQDSVGFTPLASTILGGHETITALLLARNDLDISLKDNDGDTYLIHAAYHNDGNARLVLARGGIDVNLKNREGLGALSVAASRGHDAIVALLLAQDGIDVNSVDLRGNTPLDWADKGKHQGVLELLWTAGGCTGAELRTMSE